MDPDQEIHYRQDQSRGFKSVRLDKVEAFLSNLSQIRQKLEVSMVFYYSVFLISPEQCLSNKQLFGLVLLILIFPTIFQVNYIPIPYGGENIDPVTMSLDIEEKLETCHHLNFQFVYLSNVEVLLLLHTAVYL